jgi:DNA mismatch endonuclease (patch repair protein)
MHATQPKSNSEWWRTKLDANRRRDLDTEQKLAEAGWTLVVVWEHNDPIAAADTVDRVLKTKSCSAGRLAGK